MNDELISAYLDGQLNEGERAAFEQRVRADVALRQQMQVTRLMTQTAQQLPAPALPRSFVLPNPMARPEKARRTWDLRVLFRLGSALAMALFVALVGLDLSRLATPNAIALTPNALATFAPQALTVEPRSAFEASDTASNALPMVTALATSLARATQPQEVAPAAAPVANTMTQSAEASSDMSSATLSEALQVAKETARISGENTRLMTATPAPEITRSPIAVIDAANTTATAPQPSVARPANQPANLPTAFTPVPTLASVVAMPEAGTPWPLTRILAGVALIAGAVLAVLGWRR